MTREEARTFLQKWLDETLDSVRCDHSAEWCEAINMAISALSAEDDLISRQWLLDLYGDYIGDNGEPKYHVPLEVVRQNIIDAPLVDRPSGEWVNQDNGAFYPYECSNCHKQPFCDDYGYHLTNYCANCGAKMKGGAE